MKKKIIPIFVPHQGCPHDCIFCNQKKITGVSTDMTGEKARNIIEDSLKTIDRDAEVEIAFFGGSFTAIDKDKQIELLSVAKEYKDRGLVKDIRMSTRPDCIDEEELELIKTYGATIIELGVQSMDEKVLMESLRGHERDVVYKSSKLIKDFGFRLGLQMMIGLPTDSEDKCIYTAREFIKIKPDFVRIYPTLVIKDTGLENAYNEGYYKAFTLEESIDIVKKLIVLYEINEIGIIRVGLQATDDIQLGIDVITGPYHPAFRELVKSRMIRDYLESILPKDFKTLVIYTSNENISTVVGNKRSNRIFINKNYNAKFKTKVDESLKDSIKIEVDDKVIKIITFKEMILELEKIYGLC
ncbi:elongator complex protein 3 [Peptostreptococcus russellii]|uniref:elongator complex protein 3 n=1 Tax=Peptostreptococcus russellii TaxID=215200 RepID=UPI002941D526|nr:radical SAM protein [Peptostreptococcus russellii]